MFVNPVSCSMASCSETGCSGCLHRRQSLFGVLTAAELATLEKSRYRISYREGEVIFKEDTKPSGLLCLQSGKVKVVRRGIDGNDQIVALKKPGDFLGFKALVQESRYSATAYALEDCSVCIVDRKEVLAVIHQSPRLPMEIIRALAHETDEANDRLLRLTKKHMRARLADSLFWVLDTYGMLPDQVTLNVSLKRADLAALANMTTANAIRILSSFVKEKLIETDRRHIRIIDRKGLEEVSELGR